MPTLDLALSLWVVRCATCVRHTFVFQIFSQFVRDVARAVQDWINAIGAKTAYVESGSPWENGYCESFNARFRDEFLNGEIFYSLREAQILIEEWRKHYNTKRPHSPLGYRPPAPEAIVPIDKGHHALTTKLDHIGGADHCQVSWAYCSPVFRTILARTFSGHVVG